MNDQHNSKLTGNSQRLRREMTDEERHFWYVCLKVLPVIINRQKIIGNYIVDFYCASAKLVIEVDGSQHYDRKEIEQDNRRDEYLRGLGLTVKRYSNIDINQRFENVSQDIYHFIFGKENRDSKISQRTFSVKVTPHPALCATFPSRGRQVIGRGSRGGMP